MSKKPYASVHILGCGRTWAKSIYHFGLDGNVTGAQKSQKVEEVCHSTDVKDSTALKQLSTYLPLFSNNHGITSSNVFKFS